RHGVVHALGNRVAEGHDAQRRLRGRRSSKHQEREDKQHRRAHRFDYEVAARMSREPRCRPRILITWAGFPVAIALSGMSNATTVPAPITAPAPMWRPGGAMTPCPSHA